MSHRPLRSTVSASIRSYREGLLTTVLLPCGIALLLGIFWAELPLLDRWVLRRGRPERERRRPRYVLRSNRVHPNIDPTRRPLEVVAADLRRLSRQLALVPAGAPLVRWRALWFAYDAVLTEAAQLLEVPHDLPGTPVGIARDIERLRVVSALEGAGLVVRG
jgi:hypothetical protein